MTHLRFITVSRFDVVHDINMDVVENDTGL